MGLRLDIKTANWVSYLIEENAPMPDPISLGFDSGPWVADMVMHALEEAIISNFLSSDSGDSHFIKREFSLIRDEISNTRNLNSLEKIRRFFNPRNWTAFILPSGNNNRLDNFLCSHSLLRTLVDIGSTDRGLVLQLKEPPENIFALTEIFPAFAKAIENRTEWPALLVWNKKREIELFPLQKEEGSALENLIWILRHLADDSLHNIKQIYEETFSLRPKRVVNIIQISDIHLGSKEANIRLPRLQQHIIGLVERYKKESDVMLIVTGDLMDEPDFQSLDQVRAFVNFLNSLQIPPPILLIGNHDVRRSGILDERLRAAIQLPLNGALSGVHWLDKHNIGIVAFNSVTGGYLATGLVGERQFDDLSIHLDQKRNRDDFVLLGAIHHHPIPVRRPSWYLAPFYERILGDVFEETDCLHDAKPFQDFVENQGIAAVIHGHKHIPRLDVMPNSEIPVIGCGSSVGKINTVDGTPYLSINIITVDHSNQRISARLLASRSQGGRLDQVAEHQASLMVDIGNRRYW